MKNNVSVAHLTRPRTIPFQGVVPKIDPSAFIDPTSTIIGDVVIEEDVCIFAECVIRGDEGQVYISKGTIILDNVSVISVRDNPVHVGAGCLIQIGSLLAGCQLGDENIVNPNASVLEGTRTGNGCMIEANSAIPPKREYPSGAVINGSPGAIKRSLYQSEIDAYRKEMERLRTKAKYYMEYYAKNSE
ncbi:MAG: gamma carbonic anhydrase family protein [Thermoplasmata archaeon]